MRTLLLLLALGCRFGGPGPAPETDPPLPDAAAQVAADAPLDTLVMSAPDAATAPGGCAAPTPATGCDPVCNTGCPMLSRCDVGEGTRTGRCVGIWIGGEGSTCFKGATTDACAPRLTCVEGACRRLCYRDSDCTPGTCCNAPLPSGFTTCSPCGG